MITKHKISFVVPENLYVDLRERIIGDRYGFRDKSKWISEAIEKLLAFNNFIELVSYGDELHGFEKTETIVIDYALKTKLEEAIVKIRKEFPMIEGVKSRIVRTAILQRLLRG
ncbi:MAG: hypothetical protein JSS53_06975 [Proteobacteria bacterium]|nr:hypothetical protein [Pseudomonadota bacterium]